MKKEEFGVLIDGLTASQITHTKRSHRTQTSRLGLARPLVSSAWLVPCSLSWKFPDRHFPIPGIMKVS